MSTSPSKKFGLKRASEFRNASQLSNDEISEIKLTNCESTPNNENQGENISENNIKDIPIKNKDEVFSV